MADGDLTDEKPFWWVMADPDDLTDEKLNPQPALWPQCSKCGQPYALRRALSFTQGHYVWAWMRDCAKPRSTCKGAKPVIFGPDGPYEEPPPDGE